MPGLFGAVNLLLGVGNELHGDDGIGPWIARRFRAPGWRTMDCFTVPENYTSMVKRLQPTDIVIVDAADMGLAPGEMRVIPPGHLGTVAFSTHMLPLSLLVEYLEEATDATVTVIGIQPRQFREEMSPEVIRAGRRLMEMLSAGQWATLPPLRPSDAPRSSTSESKKISGILT